MLSDDIKKKFNLTNKPEDRDLVFLNQQKKTASLGQRSQSIKSVDSTTTILSNLSLKQRQSLESEIVLTKDKKKYLITTSSTDVFVDKDQYEEYTKSGRSLNYLINHETKVNRHVNPDEDQQSTSQVNLLLSFCFRRHIFIGSINYFTKGIESLANFNNLMSVMSSDLDVKFKKLP